MGWQHRKRSIRNTTWARKSLPLMFCRRNVYHYQPKCLWLQYLGKYSSFVTITAMHHTQNPLIQNMHSIETRSHPLHSLLDVKIEPCRTQRQGNGSHGISTIRLTTNISTCMSIQEATKMIWTHRGY